MNPNHAYAYGALVKMAELDVDPVEFVNVAAQTQDPLARKVAQALYEYGQAVAHEKQASMQKEALTPAQLALLGGAGGAVAGGTAGGLVGGPPGAVIGGGMGMPVGAAALPAGVIGARWLKQMGERQGFADAGDAFWRAARAGAPGPYGDLPTTKLLPAPGRLDPDVFETIGDVEPGRIRRMLSRIRNIL